MFLALLLTFLIILPQPIHAVDEFVTRQSLEYVFDLQGNAHVTQQTELTNNYSNIYAKEYVVQLSGNHINSITAHDQSGDIIQKITTSDKTTNINVKFNNPAVGKDKTQSFAINYKIDNLAVSKGKLWEISLPDYNNLGPQDEILVSLRLPEQFGTLSFSSMTPANQSESAGFHVINYRITQANAKTKNILALGTSQLFDFNLIYHLQNTQSSSVTTQIPIPPDTANQSVIYKSFSLNPDTVEQNNDGNWLARYTLKPNQNLTLEISGQAKILPQAKPLKNPDSDYLSSLLVGSTYWHPSDPAILQVSSTLQTPKQIYDYVINTLSYNTNPTITPIRKGDLQALSAPDQSVCTEFTDLFVSLARAAKIPAREVEGYAYSNNDKIKPINTQADILHAWPQYWDNTKGWISVDPTWGKTTNGIDFFTDLDLNHFAFVIHGQDADNPPAPGSFRQSTDAKTVNVTFASSELTAENLPLRLTTDKSSQIVKIVNPNLHALYDIKLMDNGQNWTYHIDTLPPLASVSTSLPRISFFKSILPKSQKINITTQVGDNPSDITTVAYMPHYLNLAISICAIILILAISGILVTKKLQ